MNRKDNEGKILQILRENGDWMPVRDLVKASGSPIGSISSAVYTLHRLGRVEKTQMRSGMVRRIVAHYKYIA